MAAWFNGAASQGLVDTVFPITTVPFSCGCWVYPTTLTGTQCVLTISIALGTSYITVYVAAAGAWTLEKTGGGTVTCGTAVAGQWHYVLLRGIGATSLRLSVLDSVGGVTHASNTSAGSITGFTTFSIGDFRFNSAAPTNFLTGGVGEFWITNTDVYSGGGAADDNFVRRLAYGGPLSMNRFKDDILEYKSLVSSPSFGHGDEGLFSRNPNTRLWTNTNGVLNGPHPPLPPEYGRVRPVPRLLTV